MRKLLRAMAKAKMAAIGYYRPNKQMVGATGRSIWRDVVVVYPGFKGQARQRKHHARRKGGHVGAYQPILTYPMQK